MSLFYIDWTLFEQSNTIKFNFYINTFWTHLSTLWRHTTKPIQSTMYLGYNIYIYSIPTVYLIYLHFVSPHTVHISSSPNTVHFCHNTITMHIVPHHQQFPPRSDNQSPTILLTLKIISTILKIILIILKIILTILQMIL